MSTESRDEPPSENYAANTMEGSPRVREEATPQDCTPKTHCKGRWPDAPGRDKWSQAAAAQKVGAHIARPCRGTLVLILGIDLFAHMGKKEDQTVAEHAGNAQVQHLWHTNRDVEKRKKASVPASKKRMGDAVDRCNVTAHATPHTQRYS